MRVYIAGPMRNHPFFNFAAFDEAAAQIAECGHTPINPAENSRRLLWEAGLDPECESDYSRISIETYMEDDIIALRHADALIVLDGWADSKGARVEIAYADYRGIPVWKLADFLLLVRLEKQAA